MLLLFSEAADGSLLDMYSFSSVSFGNIPTHKVVCWCVEAINIMAIKRSYFQTIVTGTQSSQMMEKEDSFQSQNCYGSNVVR